MTERKYDINTFHELFDQITYDWDNYYTLKKIGEDSFALNKLYIDPDKAVYKTSTYTLAPGLYEKVEKLYELFRDEDTEQRI